jgi:hypothetical protein
MRLSQARPKAKWRKSAIMRRSPTIARPSHRICVMSQPACVERSAPSQLICVETGALLRVGHISIARRYTYLVGSRGLQMMRRKLFQCLALPVGQVGWVAQPDISGAAQQVLALLFGAAHLIDGVVDELDGMELVESDGGAG